MNISKSQIRESHQTYLTDTFKFNWFTFGGILSILSFVLGQLGNADTVCSLLRQEAQNCGARSMLVWLGNQTWTGPTILIIGSLLILLGERKARRKDMLDAVNEMRSEFAKTASIFSKEVTDLEGRVALCEESVRILSGSVQDFRSAVQKFKEEVDTFAILIKSNTNLYEKIETSPLRSWKALDHHLNSRFMPWMEKVTATQHDHIQEFRSVNDHTVERLERLEVALAKKDIVPLPDTTDKPVRM